MDTKTWQRQMEDDDRQYVWHPFTQMQDWEKEAPLIIERGEGNYLLDIYGNRYLDGISSLWVILHGHRKQELNEAVKDQLDKIAHSTLLGLANVPSIQLAKKLVALAPPGLVKVFYSDNGSTAVEIGLKMAFQYWQQIGATSKVKFISFTNAYHGDTIGSVSVGGIDLFHQLYKPLLFDTIKAPYPYCYRCAYDKKPADCDLYCAKILEQLAREKHQELAALVIEPLIQGAAGMITAPPGFLKRVKDICYQYNILMIADEVATGFGRTGKMFACEHEGVSPDILSLAKGITGGYLPLAATLTTEEIYKGFCGEYRDLKTFFHGHTYTGNPLAVAAALANLEIFEKEEILVQLPSKIAQLQKGLESFNNLKAVGDVRQCGMMVGMELVKDKITREPYSLEERIGHQVIMEARKAGVILRPLGNVVVLMPPLSIEEQEIDYLLTATYKAIEKVTENKFEIRNILKPSEP
jgi:adenosylmethionine-8-amino-7-oxononanoate aminotransferase